MVNNENKDILWELESNKENQIDIETLSTFLTDNELKTDELKKIQNEKNINNQENNNVYDININSINDLINLLLKNQYDFVMIEPINDFVKVVFKKDQVIKNTLNIKYHIYWNILLQAKKISKLNIEETNIEQKSSGEYLFENRMLEILSRTVPWNFWEILYIKVRESKKNNTNTKVKKTISTQAAFWFLWTILTIGLILWAAFLSFVIFNAQTPDDVGFFVNLWININDINNFLSKMTTYIFSVVIFILTILLIISLFKWILTKKEFKRKKTVYLITSWFLLFLLFWTWTLWISLDKSIKKLPNWQEMSYWNIQIYDNWLLVSKSFNKSNSLISDYTNIIWPIDIKFDLTYLQKSEARNWFIIQKYIWDFWNWNKIESQNPNIIEKFDKKWIFKVSLTIEWIDKRFPSKISQKQVSEAPSLNISRLVNITSNSLDNWWKTYRFNASDLKELWDIEWYYKDNLNSPTYQWEIFEPSKIFFDEDIIWMKIRKKDDTSNSMDKIFVLAWEKSKISWEIKQEASIDNDLSYTFRVEKIENTQWAWFIKNFRWIIWNKEFVKEADIQNLEESSEVKFDFIDYWKQSIKVIITNTMWKSTQIVKIINIPKKMKIQWNLDFYINNEKYTGYKFDEITREYSLFDIWAPTHIKIDSKYLKPDNPLYTLTDINWEQDSDWKIDSKWTVFDSYFTSAWKKIINVKYTFTHRKEKNETIEIKDAIILNFVEKDAIVDFEIKQDSEYVPVVVSFDASKSKAKNENIVKFIYDYWDWLIEERDAINPWHKYLKEWKYNIKLTIVTESWKEFSAYKSLVLKAPVLEWKIDVSMKKAPVNQEIDFLSTWSIWQVSTYHWDFWDGSTSNEANPSHAFSKPWEYKVVLTLEYSNNNIISLDTTVKITE